MMTTENELREKERRARELLDKKGLAALALSTQANFAWITGGGDNHVGITSETGVATAVITRDRKFVVCDNIEAPRIADEEVEGRGFEVVSYPWHEGNLTDKLRALVGSGEVGADTAIPGTVHSESDLEPYRRSLTPEEIERYRWVGTSTAECMNAVCRALEPGLTEYEIAAMLNHALRERGMISTVTLIAVDDRIRNYRHPIPTERQLERHAMVVVGAKRWGLIISMTRLVHFGELSAELIRKHKAVTAVDAAFIANTVPGADVAEIFDKAVAEYAAQGYAEEWKLHHQGGPTGYKGREYRATGLTHVPVAENQAFSWNPSITGTKSEDTIIATPEGPEIISAIEVWPMIDTDYAGRNLPRPDILVSC